MDGRNRGTLAYRGSSISFLKFGKGDRLMIAMHGYSENASCFKLIEPALAKKFVVVAIDLPFHGATDWKGEQFTPEAIQDIILLILEKEAQSTFYLLGFSLGGRLALGVLPYFKEELRGLWLIAPDGLENRWVDRVMKVPSVFRKLLYRLVQRPAWIIRLAERLYRWNLVTPFVPKFLRSELSTASNRDRAFGIWASLDFFRLDRLARLKSNLIARQIPVQLFFGKRDWIIPMKLGEALSDNAENIFLHRLEGGHMLINTMLNVYLTENQKCLD